MVRLARIGKKPLLFATPRLQSVDIDEPADWLPGAAARPLGPHVGRQVYTRVIPMRAHCWGSDMNDTEELADNLAAATELVLGGTQMPLNAPIVTGGGFLRDTLGNRGLCYVLRVNFYAPIFSPLLDSAQMKDLAMIITAKTGGYIPPGLDDPLADVGGDGG